jgi:ATP-dependent RNA helicase RhlE
MTHTDTGRFSDLGIREKLLAVLTEKGFTKPTPIQHQVISAALGGTDIVGIAQTGTGKTLAFGIPMIQRLGQTDGRGLIITPTRELAIQVEAELRKIGAPLGLRTTVVIGGVSQSHQERAIRKDPHIIIATPGRLVDLMEQRIIKLQKISIVTLDEADRMMDMGFLPGIKKVMQQVGQDRQTLLFSATMPKEIAKMAAQFMKTPLRVEIAPQGTSAKNVEQELYFIPKSSKMQLLESVLKEYSEETVIVFSRTKHGAKRITRKLNAMGHTAAEIHGNKSQNQRQKALEGFIKKRYRVLVATDIAARGIDVDHVGLVINFDLPDGLEDYVHRIGRTGRAGRSGKAISFATTDQRGDVRGIERIIKKSLKVLDLPMLPDKRPDEFDKTRGGGGNRNRRPQGNRVSGTRSGASRRSSNGARNRRPASAGGNRSKSRSTTSSTSTTSA